MPHPTEYLLHAGIETRFHPATNSRGSRISARRCDHRRGEKIVWTDWNCDLNSLSKHVKAAQHFAEVYDVEHPLGPVAISTQRGFVFYLDWDTALSATEEGS